MHRPLYQREKYSVEIAFAIVKEIEWAPMQAGWVQTFLPQRVSCIFTIYIYIYIYCSL